MRISSSEADFCRWIIGEPRFRLILATQMTNALAFCYQLSFRSCGAVRWQVRLDLPDVIEDRVAGVIRSTASTWNGIPSEGVNFVLRQRSGAGARLPHAFFLRPADETGENQRELQEFSVAGPCHGARRM
jgi:hypothetical protein